MEDEKGIDEKILAVAENDPVYREFEDIVQIPHHLLEEIQEFFRTYKNLENPKDAEVKEWRGREAAFTTIADSIKRFKEKFSSEKPINPL